MYKNIFNICMFWNHFVDRLYIFFPSSKSYLNEKYHVFITAQRRDTHLTKDQESRLPVHWLKSKGAHTTMVDALWRLRDLMLRDSLNICQAYNL